MSTTWRTWEYDFPPFFTLQPVEKTRTQQINSWAKVILSYCESENISSLDITNKLFKNDKIDRALSNEDINQIFQDDLFRFNFALVGAGGTAIEVSISIPLITPTFGNWRVAGR